MYETELLTVMAMLTFLYAGIALGRRHRGSSSFMAGTAVAILILHLVLAGCKASELLLGASFYAGISLLVVFLGHAVGSNGHFGRI